MNQLRIARLNNFPEAIYLAGARNGLELVDLKLQTHCPNHYSSLIRKSCRQTIYSHALWVLFSTIESLLHISDYLIRGSAKELICNNILQCNILSKVRITVLIAFTLYRIHIQNISSLYQVQKEPLSLSVSLEKCIDTQVSLKYYLVYLTSGV